MSALSGGPLAPGDKIGGSNTSLILSTCRADGVLLKPDRPATPIDSYWSVRAFGVAEPETKGPRGELWSTEVTISGLTWQLVFGTKPNWRVVSEIAAPSHLAPDAEGIPAEGPNECTLIAVPETQELVVI